MKRQGITLEAIAERNNLLLAVHKAARGKQQRQPVAHFLQNLDAQLNRLAADILQGRAPSGRFRSFSIYDPKYRQIHAACFADRVLHHAILNLAEPRFEAMLVDSCYACRPGKGVHAAVAQVQQNLRRFAFVVQVDVAGYFPAICHLRLKALLATRFKGKAFLALLGRIIDASPGAGCVPGHGLPIGALTSQHFANAYLDIADRYLLAYPGVRAHVRYMDDIVWWCDSRATAMATLADFTRFLSVERGLTLKANAHIGHSGAGITYCGFRVRQGLVLPSQRKLVRYRQHMGLMEQALAHGGVADADLQRASSSAHAALAHSASQRFRINFWKQQASAYDGGPMLYDDGAVPNQPALRLARCGL